MMHWAQKARLKAALDLLQPQPYEKILDYGAGSGQFGKDILDAQPLAEVTLYEPEPQAFARLADEFPDKKVLSKLTDEKYDKICCLEVLEHLLGDRAAYELTQMRNALQNTGRLVISVPIEVGLPSLLKNIIRIVAGKAHHHTTLANVARSTLGMPVERIYVPAFQSWYTSSHIGFDYRELEKQFDHAGLHVLSRHYSPAAILGRYLNSQVLYILSK